ncbi:DUF5906 domain-containing protein [Massilia sp. CCM 9210]|uniref:primase-helicase family protein n=1 Tax=Massilia scottii TaxID=3057166 RepID=UPI0027968035|nr:primase-helicase family protein [Massilia sp. CCM 9210]MDQ1817461.1 DUF5906 domain-containing protein [Massilia sp. CCM 9210]
MTQPAPTLATANPPALSDAEKKTISLYVENLKSRGFCKLDDSASNQTKLYNRNSQASFHTCFLENDFDRWCYANNKNATYPSSRYIMKTLRHVVGHKFDPRGEEYSTAPNTHLTYVNTYRRYKPSSDSVPVSPLWNEFWERFIANPVQRHQALQWLAHLFQKPWERPSWHLMWPSSPGMGKGYLFGNILHPLLTHTEVINSYSRLMDKFSTMLETSLIVLLDDCKTTSDSTQTKLKSILSEERQHVERKTYQGSMVNCYTRFILASNEVRPLYLDSDERRWLVFDRLVHRVDRTETQEFITRFDAWLQSPGALDSIYHWFVTYDIADFNHKNPPESDALKEMVAMSINVHEEFTANYMLDHAVFTRKQLLEAFDEDGLSKPKDSHLPNIMLVLGYTKAQYQIDGNRATYYYPIGWTKEQVEQQVQGLCKPCARPVQDINNANFPF